ncbi:hypothetical protein KP509_14G042800 [Ceratopteris richardii]|uniref:Uncharacterized protein n=1 Tax=Ceratopteris richardii TaxID=49495 RepID=A0A8T2T9A0_CERRI|nr:hypothetical protein KP509_14G042800 [Ceratopteris richardii]
MEVQYLQLTAQSTAALSPVVTSTSLLAETIEHRNEVLAQKTAQNKCCSHKPNVNLQTLADTESAAENGIDHLQPCATHIPQCPNPKPFEQIAAPRVTRKATSACDAPSQLPKVPKWSDVGAQAIGAKRSFELMTRLARGPGDKSDLRGNRLREVGSINQWRASQTHRSGRKNITLRAQQKSSARWEDRSGILIPCRKTEERRYTADIT